MLKIRNFDVAAGKGYIDFWHFDVAAGHRYIDFAGIKDLDSEPLSFPKRHHKENIFWMLTQTGLDSFEINVSLGQGYIENSTA